MLQTKLRFIKRTIYKLKRSYGLPVHIYEIDQHTLNTETGVKNTVLDVEYIRLALVLRAREFRSFVYDLAYISANKDFTTGAYFDPEDRVIVIDCSDLTRIHPQSGDFILVKNDRYQISDVYHYEDASIYTLNCRKIRGAPVTRIESNISVVLFEQQLAYIIVDKFTREVLTRLDLTQSLIENV